MNICKQSKINMPHESMQVSSGSRGGEPSNGEAGLLHPNLGWSDVGSSDRKALLVMRSLAHKFILA